jgi:hypothetical protein
MEVCPMAAPAQPTAPVLYKGTNRHLVIPACLLTPNDLRRLYRLLEQKAKEAADRQVTAMTLLAGQTQAQFDQSKMSVRESLSLTLRLQTKSGSWVGGHSIDPLEDEQLLDGITKIEFDSCFLFRLRFNNATPNNTFLVVIDLVRPGVLDFGADPMQNASLATISGVDVTWANGLYAELESFFEQSTTRRGWLHLRQSYTVLLILFGLPLSFEVVYHLDRMMRRKAALPEALSVAVYVYVVLVVVFLFRIIFNYGRWVFPKVELDAPRQHVGVRHRVAISALVLMVIGALVKAALRLCGIG